MVTIKIVATAVADTYVRYHGKSVDEPLDPVFWDTQPDKVIGTTKGALEHTQTVQLAEGPHYVIYGNSAAVGYIWHVQIFVNETLIAEGDVDRGSQLRGDFTAGPAASINGHVKDAETLNPISAALVECNSLTTRTDELGYYEFTGLDPKTYTVSASAAGYIKKTKTVDAVTPETYTADFELTKELLPSEAGKTLLKWIGIASTVALGLVVALKLKK